MNLIEEGIKKGLIKFDSDERKTITYIHQKKSRNYHNPEEQVQADSFLLLVLRYNYKPENIKQFVSVTMGASVREADIVVYNDNKHISPHIVVECKKQEVSELEFTQAIEQGFSYAVAEGAKYVWTTSGIKDAYFEVPKNKPKARMPITDIPQFGIEELAKFKYAKNGGEFKGQKLFPIETVLEDELTRRFKQAHNSLWGGGELNPSEAFDELDKIIFCKVWDERKLRKNGEAYDFQIFSEETEEKTNKSLLDRIKSLYEEGRKKDPEVFKDGIRLNAQKLRTVVGYLESVDLGNTDLDSKGRAFETFMGSFFRGDFGQFFTPRPIVKFIVDVLPIKHDSLVLDTSCGSGGFLLHALDKVRKEASEYYPGECGSNGGLESARHKDHWHDFAENNLYGIEINEQIARTAKMNMIIHDDGHTNVIAADGLLPINDVTQTDQHGVEHVIQKGISSKTDNKGFKFNRFDFIITNPPFGSSVRQTEQAYMHQYGYAQKDVDWLNPRSKVSPRDNQSTEVLFIEQCYNYLIAGGCLAVVAPDGILTNSSMQYVRDGIEEKFRILAVVSLPQTAFSATGAGVKSSVLILKKYSKKVTEYIQNQKLIIQEEVRVDNLFFEKLKEIDSDKKKHVKDLVDFDNTPYLVGKALTNSERYKDWKKEVNTIFKDKIDDFKEELTEKYVMKKQEKLTDYSIFMAIAEDIGYDATGKETNNNELDEISPELERFISEVFNEE
jgi:type I restriction enzyme M protein